ncbi:sulfatase-like hydrolase/transferase, partial [Candidatus Hydrogenedentota bacterium]
MKEITRRNFLRTVGVGAAAATVPGCFSAPKETPVQQPNVLFIAIDDISTNISAFENPGVKTPNLEALAKRGMAFDRAYCQFPLCSPSRTSVITGIRPATSGVLSNTVHWRELNPDVVTLPQLFSANGYESIHIGKILHGKENETDARWDRMIHHMEEITLSGKKGRELEGLYNDAIKAGRKPAPMDYYFQWGPSGLDGTDMLDGRFAEQAMRVLSEKREKPFFLALGFGNPHL